MKKTIFTNSQISCEVIVVNIEDIKNTVAQIAPSYPVSSIDLFGSYAKGNPSKDSDLDLLVCFDDDIASLFDLAGLRLDIQDKLKINVDIVAGPLKEDSYLIIDKKVRIYETQGYATTKKDHIRMQRHHPLY